MSQYLPNSGFKQLNQQEIDEFDITGISHDMLPRYCSHIADQQGIKVGGVNKLVANSDNKDRYVLHYRNLQMYLLLGMKLIKVHRMLGFEQSDWLNFNID